jgi:hypothetical protein
MNGKANGFVWVMPKVGIGGRRASGLAARIAVYTKSEKRAAAITLYTPLMKKAKMLSGDKVMVATNADGDVLLKRVNGKAPGFTLSPVAGSKQIRAGLYGKTTSAVFKFSSGAQVQSATYDMDEIVFNEDESFTLMNKKA